LITEAKLATYQRFRGDVDHWSRIRTPAEGEEFRIDEWRMIEELLNRLKLYGSEMVAQSFDDATDRIVRENVDGDATAAALRRLATRRGR